MDNSVNKLIGILEPLIANLEERKEHLSERKEELENVSRLLAYTKDNIDMVGVYADQDLILNNLSKINTDKDEYKASCYLLKSENESIKNLPQYKEAYNLISDLIEFFKLYKAELIVETQDLEKNCQKKEIEKKYYDILKEPTPFIDDVREFRDVLDSHTLSNDDKINILIYAIKNNALKYEVVTSE